MVKINLDGNYIEPYKFVGKVIEDKRIEGGLGYLKDSNLTYFKLHHGEDSNIYFFQTRAELGKFVKDEYVPKMYSIKYNQNIFKELLNPHFFELEDGFFAVVELNLSKFLCGAERAKVISARNNIEIRENKFNSDNNIREAWYFNEESFFASYELFKVYIYDARGTTNRLIKTIKLSGIVKGVVVNVPEENILAIHSIIFSGLRKDLFEIRDFIKEYIKKDANKFINYKSSINFMGRKVGEGISVGAKQIIKNKSSVSELYFIGDTKNKNVYEFYDTFYFPAIKGSDKSFNLKIKYSEEVFKYLLDPNRLQLEDDRYNIEFSIPIFLNIFDETMDLEGFFTPKNCYLMYTVNKIKNDLGESIKEPLYTDCASVDFEYYFNLDESPDLYIKKCEIRKVNSIVSKINQLIKMGEDIKLMTKEVLDMKEKEEREERENKNKRDIEKKEVKEDTSGGEILNSSGSMKSLESMIDYISSYGEGDVPVYAIKDTDNDQYEKRYLARVEIAGDGIIYKTYPAGTTSFTYNNLDELETYRAIKLIK